MEAKNKSFQFHTISTYLLYSPHIENNLVPWGFCYLEKSRWKWKRMLTLFLYVPFYLSLRFGWIRKQYYYSTSKVDNVCSLVVDEQINFPITRIIGLFWSYNFGGFKKLFSIAYLTKCTCEMCRDLYMLMLLFQAEKRATSQNWKQVKRWSWLIRKAINEQQLLGV